MRIDNFYRYTIQGTEYTIPIDHEGVFWFTATYNDDVQEYDVDVSLSVKPLF